MTPFLSVTGKKLSKIGWEGETTGLYQGKGKIHGHWEAALGGGEGWEEEDIVLSPGE